MVCIKKVNMKTHILKLLLLYMSCASPRNNPIKNHQPNKKNTNFLRRMKQRKRISRMMLSNHPWFWSLRAKVWPTNPNPRINKLFSDFVENNVGVVVVDSEIWWTFLWTCLCLCPWRRQIGEPRTWPISMSYTVNNTVRVIFLQFNQL